jgi:hypothetical protein
MLKEEGCTAEFNSKIIIIVSFSFICSSESLYKSVDFNLSIYKLDLINAELVFKNSKPICLIIMHRIL